MSYDAWKLRAPEDEPGYSDNNPPSADCDGVTCRGCGHFVLDSSEDEEAFAQNGWWWCSECYYDLPEVIEALNDIAARSDFE